MAEPGLFGSLKLVLSNVCINYEVCFQLSALNPSLTISPAGDRCHQEQGRRYSLPDRRIERVLQFVSERHRGPGPPV
jgi:hypothetical protein